MNYKIQERIDIIQCLAIISSCLNFCVFHVIRFQDAALNKIRMGKSDTGGKIGSNGQPDPHNSIYDKLSPLFVQSWRVVQKDHRIESRTWQQVTFQIRNSFFAVRKVSVIVKTLAETMKNLFRKNSFYKYHYELLYLLL